MGNIFGPAEVVGGIAIGTGVGAAVGDVVVPKLQDFLNTQWSNNQHKPLSAGQVAEAIAELSGNPYANGTEAANTGFNATRLGLLTDLARTAPSVAQALILLRRDLIDPSEFDHALWKAKLPLEWHGPLLALREELLDPAVLAVAVQRGIIPDQGILPVAPGSGPGKVPSFPVFDIKALEEALGSGVSNERFKVMVGNVGLPASNEQAASAYFRGIIELNDYHRAISEGNTRNEWRDAILEQARQILTAGQYTEAHLRGWIDLAAMTAGAAKHGMSAADADLLFKLTGRPIPVHQVTTGLARGGTFGGSAANIPEAFLRSLQEGNQRPEWYSLSYANRFTYPSAFVLRALTQAGDLTEAETHQILLDIGWRPDLALTVSAKWSAGTTAGQKAETKAELLIEYEGGYITEQEFRDALTTLGYTGTALDHEVHMGDARRVSKWREKVVDAIGKAYIGHIIDAATATADLAAAGVTGEAADLLLPLWTLEQRVSIKTLTNAQVKTAYKKSLLTLDQALAELEAHDLSVADATTYLAS